MTCAVSEEKVKDYRYYLRMWAKEKDPKTETIKDLPRMNQVRGVMEEKLQTKPEINTFISLVYTLLSHKLSCDPWNHLYSGHSSLDDD